MVRMPKQGDVSVFDNKTEDKLLAKESKKACNERKTQTSKIKKSLHEIPELSKTENIYIWLESSDGKPGNYRCDCFEPDLVHYACVDVTELDLLKKINV